MNVVRHILIFTLLGLLIYGLVGSYTYELDSSITYYYNYNLDNEYNNYTSYNYHTELFFNKNGTFERYIHKSYIKNNNINEYDKVEHGRFNVIKYINNIDNNNKYSWASSVIELSDIEYLYSITLSDNTTYDVLISPSRAIIKESILDEDRSIILDILVL